MNYLHYKHLAAMDKSIQEIKEIVPKYVVVFINLEDINILLQKSCHLNFNKIQLVGKSKNIILENFLPVKVNN